MQGGASYAIFDEEDFGDKNIERNNHSAILKGWQEEERERQLKEFEEEARLKLAQM